MRVWRILSVVIMLATVLAMAGCSNGAGTEKVPEVGDTAPDFTLQSLSGKKVSLSDYRGKPVLLNFWATWCEPCRGEMPFLQEVAEDTEWTAQGLVILAVNLGESAAAVGDFVDRYGLTFTVLLDTTDKVGMQYNARYIPTTYFIDKDGIIRSAKIGAFSGKSEIDGYIVDMLFIGES